jgi:hypothetical protein
MDSIGIITDRRWPQYNYLPISNDLVRSKTDLVSSAMNGSYRMLYISWKIEWEPACFLCCQHGNLRGERKLRYHTTFLLSQAH